MNTIISLILAYIIFKKFGNNALIRLFFNLWGVVFYEDLQPRKSKKKTPAEEQSKKDQLEFLALVPSVGKSLILGRQSLVDKWHCNSIY